MIQFFIQFCKSYQRKYDEFLELLNFASLTCSKCSGVGHCVIHAYYTRQIATDEQKEPIEITRVQCTQCSKTHALLPDWIVPYSQILLVDHKEIISLYEDGKTAYEICNKLDHSHIDTSHIAYIVKQYIKNWRERLLSAKVTIKEETSQLVKVCFSKFKKQFMQNREMQNILFITNHIA